MDNLAHSLCSIAVCNIFMPKQVSTHKWHMWITSVLVTNTPDLDILLYFLGKEVYFFNHRGLTHSLFGLLFLVPFLFLIVQFFLKKGGVTIQKKEIFFFILIQLVFSHFFLDFLTSYGTMFLYPFSWERFSFPLMFIIDPLFWCIGIIAFIISQKYSRNYLSVRKVGLCALGSFCALWSIELVFKKYAELSYLHKKSDAIQHRIISYPIPLAPLGWLILEQTQSHYGSPLSYNQGVISFFSSIISPKVELYNFSQEFKVNALCNAATSSKAKEAFERYRNWGEHVGCRNYTWNNKLGCQCITLKYTIAEQNSVAFGGYFIENNGNTEMIPGNFKRIWPIK